MLTRATWVRLAALTAAVLAGWLFLRAEHPVRERRILYYRDPMHPSYTSKTPGRAPDCGMALEPVYADETPLRQSTRGLVLSPSQQHLIGVQLTTVTQEPMEVPLRALGRVAPDDTRVYTVSAGADGWVREVYETSTGSFVRKGSSLARLFSRELLNPEQAYLYALEAVDPRTPARIGDDQQSEVARFQLRQAADVLHDLGLGPEQIQSLTQDRQFTDQIVIRAPATGFILNRNISAGQRFSKGEAFYRIADLTRIWIWADVTSEQARFLRGGEKATVILDGKETGVARVMPVLPQFDASARTLRVQLEASNPSFELRPDQFVDLILKIRLPPAVTVPSDAIVDSGLKKTVYVGGADGHFEARTIQTGWQIGERRQVTEGLAPGERVVTAGNFLIDSEIRMRERIP